MAKPFFINKPRKARRKLYGAAAAAKRGKLMGAAAKAARRNKPKRSKSRKRSKAKSRRTTVKSIVSTRTKKPVSVTTWRASGFRRNKMPRRSKRTGRFVRGGSRGRSRSRYRRNPPLMRGIVGQAIEVLTGGAGVTAGKVVARQGIGLLKLDASTPVGIAAQLGVALAAGIAARRFLKLKGAFVDGMVYGAAAGAAESAFKMIAPGTAEKLLGEYDVYPELAAYPTGAAMLAPGGADATALMGAYNGAYM